MKPGRISVWIAGILCLFCCLPAAALAASGGRAEAPAEAAAWDTGSVLLVLAALALVALAVLLLRRFVLAGRAQAGAGYAADVDELTGLLNKRAFLRRVREIIAAEPPCAYAILRWDIDRFRVYNDLYGIASGDALLRRIGVYAGAHPEMFWGETLAHLDADHFACCVRSESVEPGRVVAAIEAMMDELCPDFHCVVHIGAYLVEDAQTDVNLMCDRALLALRSTKGSAPRQFAWYDESMRQASIEEQQRLSEIAAALRNGEFDIYVQPQYDQYTGAVSGAEALARWFHPEKGVLPPGAFIPVMEKNGLIDQLDAAVWEKAAALTAHINRGREQPIPISVNVSRKDLFDDNIVEKLLAITERHSVQPGWMHLEITESVYMSHPEQFSLMVDRLRDKGFIIEMDDFGSEYSSLNTLKYMPVDLLKLDIKFLSDDGAQKNNGGIILSSVIRMAHWLDLMVIAEGVETAQQADYLKSIGCRYAQGYHYARPMPKEEFLALLRESPAAPARITSFADNYFDGVDFWKPESQATAIFNTLIGAAGIFEYDGERLECICVNEKYFEALNTTRMELETFRNRVFDIIYPEDRPLLREHLERAKDSSDEFAFELRCYGEGQDAPLRWLHLRIRRVAHSIDRTAFYAAVENITQRRELELRLNSENEFCRLLMMAGSLCVFDLDRKTDRFFFQRVAPDGSLEKRTIEHYFRGRSQAAYLHPEDFQRVQELFPEEEFPESGQFDCRVRWGGREEYAWRRIIFNTIRDESGAAARVVGHVQDIEREKRREAQLAELTSALGEAQLYEAPVVERVFRHLYQTADVGEAVGYVLQALGEYYDASRAYIMEDSADHLRCESTFEWYAGGESHPGQGRPRGFRYADVGGREAYIRRFDQSGILIIEDLSRCEKELQEAFAPMGVRALIQLALYYEGAFIGVIGFDEFRGPRTPGRELVGTLLLVSQIIGMFLAKAGGQADAAHSEEFLSVIDQNPALIYIADPDTYEIIYENRKVREFMGAPRANEPCYKVFGNREAPCSKCPMRHYMQTGERRPTQLQRPDGAWILIQAMPIRWKGRECIMLFCTDITQQKAAEASLRVSDDTLRLSMEQMGKNICVYHVGSRTLDLPERFAQSWGVSPSVPNMPEGMVELLGMDPEDEDTRRYCAFYAAIERGESSGVDEFPFRHSDGRVIWYRFEFVSVFDAAGAPVQAVVAFEDTTAAHDEKRRLAVERGRLVTAVQSAYPLSISVDLAHNAYSTIDRENHPIRRFPLEGAYDDLAQLCLRCLHEEDHAPFLRLFRRENLVAAFREGRKSLRGEFTQRCDDGVWRWVEVIVLFMDDDGGDMTCVFLARVIDEQKALEEQLRAALRQTDVALQAERDYLRIINDNVAATVVIYAAEDMRVTYLGGNLLAKYGYTREETEEIGRGSLRDIVYEEDYAQASAAVWDACARRLPYLEQEYRIQRKDGTLAWVAVSSMLTRDHTGKPVYVSVMTDISERKSIEKQLRESDGFLLMASGLYNRVVYRYDIQTRRATAINPELCEEAGLMPVYEDVPERPIALGIVQPESREELRRLYAAIQAGEPSGYARVHMRVSHAHESKWYEIRFRSLIDENGRPVTTAISFLDISDTYEKELAYARYLVKTQDEEKNSIGRIEADLTADVVERQDMLPSGTADMTGWSYDRAIRYLIEAFCPEQQREAMCEAYSRASLLSCVEAGQLGLSGEYQVHFPDQSPHWICINVQFVRDPYTGNVKAFGLISDVTEEKNRDLDMRHLAEGDELTGLYNRGAAEKRINSLLEAGKSCALLMLDLDDLKTINDVYGHAEGDKALRAIGGLLRAHFREQDVLGRIGGDEFVALLLDVNEDTPIQGALHSLMHKISALRVGEQGEVPVRCSVGGAFSGPEAADFATLYHRADRALYHVKRNGKANFAFYTPEMEQDTLSCPTQGLRQSLRAPEWLDAEEVNHLLAAISDFFPLVASVNLTRNTYYMMEYACYTTKKAPAFGAFDDFVGVGAETFHPEDREGFLATFARENLLEAFRRGETRVVHTGRQLGSDGVYRQMLTTVLFFRNKEGDVCEITLAKPAEK